MTSEQEVHLFCGKINGDNKGEKKKSKAIEAKNKSRSLVNRTNLQKLLYKQKARTQFFFKKYQLK